MVTPKSPLSFEEINSSIINHPSNETFTKNGYLPLYIAHPKAKIVIIGQAPGRLAQDSSKPWNDKSGDRLREWLGVDETTFYNQEYFSHLPMDFYFPGKSKNGDLPPRKDFATQWHPQLLSLMPEIQLYLLIGQYSQMYYCGRNSGNLSQRVLNQPLLKSKGYFCLPHPSPRNFMWYLKNSWFESQTLPLLKEHVNTLLYT